MTFPKIVVQHHGGDNQPHTIELRSQHDYFRLYVYGGGDVNGPPGDMGAEIVAQGVLTTVGVQAIDSVTFVHYQP